MSNWLATIKNGLTANFMNATPAQHLEVIEAGFNHFAHRARNPQAGRLLPGPPMPGVPVVRSEQALMVFLSTMTAQGASEGRWGGHKFYYPCRMVPSIERAQAWQAIMRGVYAHGIVPRLGHDADIHIFENADWTLCEVFLCLM